MNHTDYSDAATWSGAQLLPDLAAISAHGPEAASFLHGQLSQDVQSLTPQSGRLAAYCSVKGRILASGLLLSPAPDTIWWWVDASVQASTLKRLSMFVMRSKLKLTDASQSLAAVGLMGPAAAQALVPLALEALSAPWQSAPLSEATEGSAASMLLRLPDVLGATRWLWVGPKDQAQALIDQAGLLPEGAWDWLDAMSGVPRIVAATTDQFVPQMVNFELVGGVNFKKGCYPGQEVVARSQYRGTVKRRLFVLQGQAALQPGQEVFCAQDASQPCGMVVNAALHPQHGWAALVELKLAHANDVLTVGAGPDAVPLHMGSLPYELEQA